MRKYVFADEAGNFDFSTKNGASQFFILTTVTADSPDVGDDLLTLRRDLAWDGIALESNFHATEDAQAVRDQVFGVLVDHDFRIDTTILEKRKTKQRLAEDKERFYKTAWFLHFKYVAPRITATSSELLVIAAQIGTKKWRKSVRLAIRTWWINPLCVSGRSPSGPRRVIRASRSRTTAAGPSNGSTNGLTLGHTT